MRRREGALNRSSDILPFLAATLVLAGCTSTTPTLAPVGTGWSRAPDLSVYAAMQTAGEIAREQDILCWGRNPAEVDARWRTRFSEREAWIASALEARYGADAIEASAPLRVGRERCPTFDTAKWHRHHADLLRTLELRLYPRDYWSAKAANPPLQGEGDQPQAGGGVSALVRDAAQAGRLIPLRRADARRLPLQGRI